MSAIPFTIFSPAKINLYLHITGQRANGYHELDSLVSFANIGDEIRLIPATNFTFNIKGPFAQTLNTQNNLVVQAAQRLSKLYNKPLNVEITLTKNLPVASGIGGGSGNAAAAIRGLLALWGVPDNDSRLSELLLALGADVPVCFHGKAIHMGGIGEILSPVVPLEKIALLLVNPGKSCHTADIFAHHDQAFRSAAILPDQMQEQTNLITFLKETHNDLFAPACAVIPDIKNVIEDLYAQDGCQIARMSGSGATCFGLFESTRDSHNAAQAIRKNHPDWWVEAGFLNAP